MLYLLRLFDATVFKILLFGFLITVTVGNGGASATVAPASASGSGGDTTTGVQNPPSGGTTGGGNPTSPASAAMVKMQISLRSNANTGNWNQTTILKRRSVLR